MPHSRRAFLEHASLLLAASQLAPWLDTSAVASQLNGTSSTLLSRPSGP